MRNVGLSWGGRTSASSGAGPTVTCACPHLKDTCVCHVSDHAKECDFSSTVAQPFPWRSGKHSHGQCLSDSDKVPSTLNKTNSAPLNHTATKEVCVGKGEEKQHTGVLPVRQTQILFYISQ